MALMAPFENVFQRDTRLGQGRAKITQTFYRLSDLFAVMTMLGNNSRDHLTVACHANRFPALHIAENF